jgi:uncharacterized protein (DUF58 family)
MLTDRGRFALAIGGVTYLAGWAFGSGPLYPTALGLVIAVVAAFAWVKLVGKPANLRRIVRGGDHVAGDDVPVAVQLELEGRVTPRSLVLVERIARLGEREVELHRKGDRLRGEYVIERVPRGRYPIEGAELVIEDAFGLERSVLPVGAPSALLVYPRLVELDRLFSETGSRMQEGRRLLLRRPSGFDFHSVREYEQGESLRRVHWPSTARRGQLMVKDLEDSPRDEVLVLLDADAAFAVGTPPESSFEVAVSAAGSILRAHAGRGRRAGLLVSGSEPRYQPVHTLDGDWSLALELLAAAEPDGRTPLAALLVEGAGAPSKALELCIVTSGITPRLADRLLQRSVTRRGSSIVYVDPSSFAEGAAGGELTADVRAQLARLDHAGISVTLVRRGDDLGARLGPGFPAASAASAEALVG